MTSLQKQEIKRKMNPNSLANLEKGKFKKGEVRNPNGRPTKDLSITSMIKEMLDLPCDAPIPGADGVKTWRQLIARAVLYGAAKGDTRMIAELLDRTDGKVTLPISGENGKPLFSVTFQMLNSNTQKLTEQIMNGEVK